MPNHSRLLSKTLVTSERLELSPDCLDILIAEINAAENVMCSLQRGIQSLKMIYQFNSTDKISHSFLTALKAQGYNGIEIMLSSLNEENKIVGISYENDFSLIIRITTTGDTVIDHIHSFQEQVLKAVRYDPMLINSLSGVDHWGMDEKYEFMNAALKFEQSVAVKICHKLHRGTITYNPWETRDLLLEFPQLKLCCDFSEWVMTCGRLLTADKDIIKLCAERCLHISTRVCDEEGFLSPFQHNSRYQSYLFEYEKWWKLIWLNPFAYNEGILTMSHFDPQLIQQPFVQSEQTSYSSWMNERQSHLFDSLFAQQKKK